jgi:hypothetical protein
MAQSVPLQVPVPKYGPYADWATRSKYENDPNRTTPDYETFHNHLAAVIDQMHKLGTPYPDSPNWDANDKTPAYGPGWEQMLGFGANTAAAAAVGLGNLVAIPAAGALDFANDAGNWLDYGNPKPKQTSADIANPKAPPKAPGIAPNPYAGLGLDKKYDIPGIGPLPDMPGHTVLPTYNPDYTKADELIAAARPKLDTSAFPDQLRTGAAQGLAQAAGQIDNKQGWGQALGQLVSGFAQGLTGTKKAQDDLKLQQEQKLEQFNLLQAGVQSDRAEALAKAKVDQARVQAEVTRMEYATAMERYALLQPNVQTLGDGSIVSITRDPKSGAATVQRYGQEDALKLAMALAQAKDVKSAEHTFASELRTRGPMAASMGYIANKAMQEPGSMEFLIPSDKVEAYRTEMADQMAQTAGLSGTAQLEAVRGIRNKLLMKYILTDPEGRKNFNAYMTQ